MTRPGFQVSDAADVAMPGDYDRLRLGLARMAWVKALPGARAHQVLDALAHALLFPLAQARMGAPVVRLRPKVTATASRKRKPGGGRHPDVVKHILASDVERALRGLNLPAGRWRHAGRGAAGGGKNAPLLDVLALCWELVTEAPGNPGVKLRDLRRLGAGRNRWLQL